MDCRQAPRPCTPWASPSVVTCVETGLYKRCKKRRLLMVTWRKIFVSNPANPLILCLSFYLLHLPATAGTQVEPKAGTWRTWLLQSGDELRLPPPPDEKTTQAEIEELRALEAQRDPAARQRVTYWNAGSPAYRWNTIAIPPGPANAVVNTRIMALLSVAIYDATIAAW